MLSSIGKCNIIIHLAAYLGVKNTEKNMLHCLNTNIEGTRKLLDIAVKKKIKRFIFASSSEIYGEQIKFPISEKAEPAYKSIYGLSKIVSENYVKAYKQKFKINYNIIRFFNIYGSEQRNDFVISKFAQQLKKNLALNLYGNGKQIRAFCHVDDATDGILEIIDVGKNNTIYNVGNAKEPISIINLAKKIIKMSKLKKTILRNVKFEDSDRTATREIYKRIPCINLISSHTNYKPRISIEMGIKEILRKNKILK